MLASAGRGRCLLVFQFGKSVGARWHLGVSVCVSLTTRGVEHHLVFPCHPYVFDKVFSQPPRMFCFFFGLEGSVYVDTSPLLDVRFASIFCIFVRN